MTIKRGEQALGILVLLVLVLSIAYLSGVVTFPWSQDRATVEVFSDESVQKAEIDVEVADTPLERYTGLSDDDELAFGNGMLFVHATERERTYVMRDMDFDIDIIFIGADSRITSIQHARAPKPGEDGEDLQYTGVAKWVLEVPEGYVNATDIAVDDEINIRYD